MLGILPVRSRIELQDVNGAVESHLLDMRVDCEDPLRRPGRSGRRDVDENSIPLHSVVYGISTVLVVDFELCRKLTFTLMLPLQRHLLDRDI